MTDLQCKICNSELNDLNSEYFDINSTYTPYTNIAFNFFLEKQTNCQIVGENFNICSNCKELINEFDYYQKRCTEIRDQLVRYLQEKKTVLVDINDLKTSVNNIECCNDTKDNLEHIDVKADINNSMETEIEVNEEIVSTKKRARQKHDSNILKPYKCSECPKSWKTVGELKSHKISHSKERHICEICGQAYKHKSALDIHVGMHYGVNPFTCEVCQKSFTQKGALQRHLPIHTGETPYQCDLCGKRFIHHTSFNIHQLSHTGQKPYKCPKCDLALFSGSHLKRHMRIHTGERNYICSICGRKFAEKYNLAAHQRLHNNPSMNKNPKKTHRCTTCAMTFDKINKLQEHLKNNHQDNTQSLVF